MNPQLKCLSGECSHSVLCRLVPKPGRSKRPRDGDRSRPGHELTPCVWVLRPGRWVSGVAEQTSQPHTPTSHAYLTATRPPCPLLAFGINILSQTHPSRAPTPPAQAYATCLSSRACTPICHPSRHVCAPQRPPAKPPLLVNSCHPYRGSLFQPKEWLTGLCSALLGHLPGPAVKLSPAARQLLKSLMLGLVPGDPRLL